MDEKVYQCMVQHPGVGYREKPSFDSKVHDWLLRVCADELDVSHFGGRVRKPEVPKRRKLSLQMHYVKVHSFLDADRINMHSLLLDWFTIWILS